MMYDFVLKDGESNVFCDIKGDLVDYFYRFIIQVCLSHPSFCSRRLKRFADQALSRHFARKFVCLEKKEEKRDKLF